MSLKQRLSTPWLKARAFPRELHLMAEANESNGVAAARMDAATGLRMRRGNRKRACMERLDRRSRARITRVRSLDIDRT